MDPYIDGELFPSCAVDLEAHVLGCPLCSERVAFARAVRQSLRRTETAAARRAPAALRLRAQAIAAAERRRSAISSAPRARRGVRGGPAETVTPGRAAMAIAAAAGFVCAMGAVRLGSDPSAPAAAATVPTAPPAGGAAALATIEGVLDDLVALHRRPPPPETTDPEALVRFDTEVGVPIGRPSLQSFDARFKGARLYATEKARAMLLQYTVRQDRRVTLYVFDPNALPMTSAPSLRLRLVGKEPVYVGERSGYSIAATERRGVGMALATDLDRDESARLLLAAVPAEVKSGAHVH